MQACIKEYQAVLPASVTVHDSVTLVAQDRHSLSQFT